MKRIICALLVFVLTFGFCACGNKPVGDTTVFKVTNTVDGKYTAIGIGWCIDGKRRDTQTAEAIDGEYVDGTSISVKLTEEKMQGAEIKDISVEVDVVDTDGKTETVKVKGKYTLGRDYEFELVEKNGKLKVKKK